MTMTSRYGGVIEKRGYVRLANAYNEHADEVWGMVSGKVTINTDDAIPGRFSGTINEVREYDPYLTMFAPFVYLSYLDPTTSPMTRVEVREQMGLFVLTGVIRDYRGPSTVQTIEAYDMTWLLSQRFPASNVTLTVGTNPITWIIGKLATLGFPRHDIEPTSQTITKEMTWRIGTSWLTIINDTLESVGYHHIWADRFGRLIGRKIRPLLEMSPQASFTTEMGDIGEYVRLEPDFANVKNDIIVTGNNPGDDPLVARATNVCSKSPASIYNLRTFDTDEPVYLTMTEDNPALETQADVTAWAKRLLEERVSFLQRMAIEVVPHPAMNLHEPISLYIETDTGHVAANGKWWWDQLELDLISQNPAMRLRCNKLTRFETSVTT